MRLRHLYRIASKWASQNSCEGAFVLFLLTTFQLVTRNQDLVILNQN